MKAGYFLRFFAASIILFFALQPVFPVLATLLTAPLAVLVPPLHAAQRGATVHFEWVEGGKSFHFSDVDFESLCSNFIVLGALLLAMDWPLRERLKKLGLALGILCLLDLGHLGVILGYSYHAATTVPDAGGVSKVLWGIVTIAYHMGEQIGTMVVPFFLFLLFTLRQKRGEPETAKESSPRLRSPRRESPPGKG